MHNSICGNNIVLLRVINVLFARLIPEFLSMWQQTDSLPVSYTSGVPYGSLKWPSGSKIVPCVGHPERDLLCCFFLTSYLVTRDIFDDFWCELLPLYFTKITEGPGQFRNLVWSSLDDSLILIQGWFCSLQPLIYLHIYHSCMTGVSSAP